jgi:hypothetical protein
MKKILTMIFITALTILMCYNLSYGEDVWKCYYPRDTKIVGTEFSTGGGNSAKLYIEVDVVYPDGRYIKYFDSVVSISGFFKVSRWILPDKIIFIPWDKDKIELKTE